MISYRALTILTVIFDIIIYCNGTVEECKECKNLLLKIGFEPDTGFYNFNFILQFENYEEFMEHVKTMVDTRTYNEVISTGKYSYLGVFYTSIYSKKSDELENILMTPHNYCIQLIEEEAPTFLPVRIVHDLNNVKPDEEKPLTEGEIAVLTEKIIEKCTTSILNFRHEAGNRRFKYDENNHYKCLLTTYDMAVLDNPDEEKSKLFKKISDIYKTAKPEGRVHNYYLYNIKIYEILFETFPEFVPSNLCENYFSQKK